MIQLSKAAVTEIKRIQSKQSNPNVWFRLGVETGGCAGWYYTMEFDEQCNPDDLICECDGVQVTVDSRILDDYLNGLTLDYSQDLMGGGFRFHNPKAAKTCGCGNSFSIIESSTP